MVVLRAIGAFFARIGRWIKDTAWVQPLLIVGGIFAIIFSIPYISNWVKGWFVKTDAGEVFYKQRELACDKEVGTMGAEDLLTYMSDYQSPVADSKFSREDAKNRYGEKFFLMFGFEGCSGCTTLYPAFSNADSEWKSTFKMTEDFKFWFIDVTSTDDKGNFLFLSNNDNSLYSKFDDIFVKAYNVADNSYYKKNTSDSTSYMNNSKANAEAGSKDEFISPTIFVVDLTDKNSKIDTPYGINEVFYTIPESDLPDGNNATLGYIDFLTQAWTSTGKFGDPADENA